MNKRTELERKILRLRNEIDDLAADVYSIFPEDEWEKMNADKRRENADEIEVCLDTIDMLARKAKATRHTKGERKAKQRKHQAKYSKAAEEYEIMPADGKLIDHGIGHKYSNKRYASSLRTERERDAERADSRFKDSGFQDKSWAPSKYINMTEYDNFTIIAPKIARGEPAIVVSDDYGIENGEIVCVIYGYPDDIDNIELIGQYGGDYDYSGEFISDDGVAQYVWVRCKEGK